jgi:hypothetical protein
LRKGVCKQDCRNSCDVNLFVCRQFIFISLIYYIHQLSLARKLSDMFYISWYRRPFFIHLWWYLACWIRRLNGGDHSDETAKSEVLCGRAKAPTLCVNLKPFTDNCDVSVRLKYSQARRKTIYNLSPLLAKGYTIVVYAWVWDIRAEGIFYQWKREPCF